MSDNENLTQKPYLRIAVVGACGHGKSTLIRALTEHFSLPSSEELVSNLRTSAISWVRSPRRRIFGLCEYHLREPSPYLPPDEPYPGPETWLADGSWVDAAILVVAVDEGLTHETETWVRALHYLGVDSLVVYLSHIDQMDTEPALIDLAEWEIRALLSLHCYRADEMPVIRGPETFGEEDPAGAKKAKARGHTMIRALDDLKETEREVEPLHLYITDTVDVSPGRGGRWAYGCIEEGSIAVGDVVRVLSLHGVERQAKVTGLRQDREGRWRDFVEWEWDFTSLTPKFLQDKQCGAWTNVLVSLDVEPEHLSSGRLLTTVESIPVVSEFEGVLYLYPHQQGIWRGGLFPDVEYSVGLSLASRYHEGASPTTFDVRFCLIPEEQKCPPGGLTGVRFQIPATEAWWARRGWVCTLIHGMWLLGECVITEVRTEGQS